MIVYNVTINIDDSVKDEWLEWMKSTHIPELMKTALFLDYRFLKIIGDEESGGSTYSVQYSLNDMDKFKQYEDIYAPKFRAEFNQRYKDKFIIFRTLLETV